MADRYWVGDGGNWSDNTNHWAASSGGAPGASLPTNEDNVFFDANSFTVGSQTVTVDASAYCLSMAWTGATNTPELAMAANLEVHDDLTTISAMTWSRSAGLLVFAGAIGGDITTNGIALSPVYFNKTTGNAVTLQDSFSLDTGYDLYFIGGNLDINSQTVVVPGQIIISGILHWMN